MPARPFGVREFFALLVFTGILAFQIFVWPPIGLANNGDFLKMTGRFSLCPPNGSADEVSYVTLLYRFDPRCSWDSGRISSELGPIRLALAINRIWTTSGFDIRVMGAVHLLIFSGWFALCLLLARPLGAAPWLAVIAFLTVVFTDVSYASYLNSFYTDTAAFLFLLWCVALAIAAAVRPRLGVILALALAASLLAASKAQHALAGVILGAAGAFLARRLSSPAGRCAGLAACLLLPPFSAIAVLASSSGERIDAFFSAVFYKVVRESPTAAADLAELGLGPEYLRYAGMFAFSPGSPTGDMAWRDDFSPRASYARLAVFFLRHPGRAAAIVHRDLRDWAWHVRSESLGNYPREAARAPGERASTFGWWSGLRSELIRRFPLHPLFWHLGVAAAAGLWMLRRRAEGRAAALCGIAVAASLAALADLAVATLADACETDRHLFLFHSLTDATLVLAAAAVVAVALGSGPQRPQHIHHRHVRTFEVLLTFRSGQ